MEGGRGREGGPRSVEQTCNVVVVLKQRLASFHYLHNVSL